MRSLSIYYYFGGLFIFFKYECWINKNHLRFDSPKFELKGFTPKMLSSLLSPNLIFSDKDQLLSLSIPFNREVMKIYDLDLFYVDYENYDFNKLSDLFLNIHIFIN